MALESLDEWRAYAPGGHLDVIRQGRAPSTWDECRNSRWENVLVFFCENNYSIENLNFLWAVSEYHHNAGVALAEDIIENIIYGVQPLNLYSETSGPIDEWYRDEDHDLKVDLFDRAEEEVIQSFSGTYGHFQTVVNKVRQQLSGEGERGHPR